ncbi:hypothetical protein B0I35DRAFT_417892 [Stachybotrys elegans]|uniref:Uncharacterized protein n=1 Tax=Stachybotrys elegans TaxID=80388 RepID=A0A8K0T2D2_9HYPO|nr:hypothetical protein B0I35DRAFT_417892 [Stachybotrys elegans]
MTITTTTTTIMIVVLAMAMANTVAVMVAVMAVMRMRMRMSQSKSYPKSMILPDTRLLSRCRPRLITMLIVWPKNLLGQDALAPKPIAVSHAWSLSFPYSWDTKRFPSSRIRSTPS